MIGTTNFLFGVPDAAYQTPLGAATALELAPENALGAELLAVGDEFVKSDPQQGSNFKCEVEKYQIALRIGNSQVLRAQRDELVRRVKETLPSLWSQVARHTGQIPWAVRGGLFATPRFFHAASFKPPLDLNGLNVSPTIRTHFSILETEGLVLVKILEKALASLSAGNVEEADKEMGAFRHLAGHMVEQLITYSPPSFNDAIIHRFYNHKFLTWFAGFLDQAKLVWSRFNKTDPELHQMRGTIRHLEAKILVGLGQKKEATQVFRKMAEANVLAGMQLEGSDVVQSAFRYRDAARALRREAQIVLELASSQAEIAFWESAELFGKVARMFRSLEDTIEMMRARSNQMAILGMLKQRREKVRDWRGTLEIVSKQLKAMEEDLEILEGLDELLCQVTRKFYTALEKQKEDLLKKEIANSLK